MPHTSNQTEAASVMKSPKTNCERVNGLAEADSRKKQDMPRRIISDVELHAYSHCYGD